MRRASYLSQAQIASKRGGASLTLSLRDVSERPVKRMFISSHLDFFLVVTLLCAPQVLARQYQAPTSPGEGKIHLAVVVTPKSEPPVSGLQQQDFTILDNESPQTISSFEAVNGRQAPVEVILLIDVVNTGSENVDMVREGINRFLKADEGRLAYPTMLAILTNTEI